MKIVNVNEDYFDLDNIIATNANVTCSFDKDIPADFFPIMGQRAPDSLSEKGFRTGISTWMIPAVLFNCVITIPYAYNAITRDVINADAKVANFERIQRHFYSFGALVSQLVVPTEGRAIANALLTAFTQRIGLIMRKAVDTSAKPTQMDETEKRVFAIGQAAEHAMNVWWRGEDAFSRQSMRRKRTHLVAFLS